MGGMPLLWLLDVQNKETIVGVGLISEWANEYQNWGT
jgi:hypothetical protein